MNNVNSKKTCKIIADYESAYPDPFFVGEDETVTVGKKESPWKGWVWCTRSDGESRWLPESYLDIQGETGRLLYDYNSVELTVKIGEQLTVLKEADGWYWCTNSKGKSGWVPPESVEIL